MQLAKPFSTVTTTKSLLCLLGVALAAFVGQGALAGEPERSGDYDYEPPKPGTYELPPIKTAADGNVLDSTGQPLHLQELTRGRVTVMSFIYTRCAAPRACPYATGVLRELYQLTAEDPSLAKAMRLVSLSFDPAVDTPDRMASYAALADRGAAAAPWCFLTTRSQKELQPILEAYGQTVDKKRNPRDPTGPLSHTVRVFLIDSKGNIRNIYSSDTLDTRLIIADVRTLLLESSNASAIPAQSQASNGQK